MKYATFERVVLLLGGASVLATLALASGTSLLVREVIGQILVFVVLVGAVHWGRRGGFVAAVAASIAYVVLWIPSLEPGEVSAQLVGMLLLRVVTYGLIGIVGGALCGRMKYVLASLEQSSGVDDVTGIFSQQMLVRLLDGAAARFERYAEPFCVIVLEPKDDALRAPTTNRERALARQAATSIRSDIRLVDEACRTTDGRFVVLLSQTPKQGGAVVADRLAKNAIPAVRGTVAGPSATTRCMSAVEDAEAIAGLRAELGTALPTQVLSPA